MLSVAAVWQRLDALGGPLPAERVTLATAAERVLREPVTAPEDQPPFDRAAIDGYVARLDLPAGASMQVLGDIPMGASAPDTPPLGAALRLFTGSAVPSGPLGLVMHEDTTTDVNGRITLCVAPSASFIRRRASQARAGDLLLAPGTTLQAGALALLASVGLVAPLVTRRARVAHLTTGGELIAPDAPVQPGRIRDSNSTLIAALLAGACSELVAHARTGESYEDTATAFVGLLESAPDVLLISGGSSGGAHDHTARLLTAHGFTLVVEQVASRPGKPLLVAVRGAQIAFGLPGNPISHFVCFHLFVARVLARLAGAAPAPLLRLPLAPGAALRPHPRETWWPASRTTEGYAPLPWADSSDLTALVRTQALLRVPSAATPESTADGLLV
jgi:molybdopterin molybdotransferase